MQPSNPLLLDFTGMRVATIILGAGAVAFLIWLLLPTEEARIMHRLEQLAGVVNESVTDSSSARNTYSVRVASFFSMNGLWSVV